MVEKTVISNILLIQGHTIIQVIQLVDVLNVHCTYILHVYSFRATLGSYAKVVRGQGRSQYAPVYAVMTQLLKIGFGQL